MFYFRCETGSQGYGKCGRKYPERKIYRGHKPGPRGGSGYETGRLHGKYPDTIVARRKENENELIRSFNRLITRNECEHKLIHFKDFFSREMKVFTLIRIYDPLTSI